MFGRERLALEEGEGRKKEKRFSLSGESFAKERIAAIREIVKNYRKERPEFLSLCLFGSMVKGSARPESDIDGVIFIDGEKKPKGADLERDRFEIRNKLKDKLQLADGQLWHISLAPISEKIIDFHLDRLLAQIKAQEKYQEKYQKWILKKETLEKTTGEIPEEEYTEKLNEVSGSFPQFPDQPKPSRCLSAMFHLDVGGGIGNYRKYLIEKLAGLGKAGKEAWREIIEDAERLEHNFRVEPEKRHYPRALEEAKKIYAKEEKKEFKE